MDAEGFTLVDFLPKGENLKAVRYVQMLKKLRRTTSRESPGENDRHLSTRQFTTLHCASDIGDDK
jgi:hypothetical protein